MAKQTINVGTTANDKKGDSLRAAFTKVNANFTELYTALGLNTDGTLNLGAFEFSGSTMSTTDSTAITIDQSVTVSSDLTVGGDILPSIANGGNLGSAAKPFNSLYVSNNTVFLGGVPLSLEAGTNTLKVNNVPISQNITYADIPSAPTDISDLTDNTGLLGSGTGDITFAASTVSAGTNDEVIVQAKGADNFATARLNLEPEYSTAKLSAFSSESVDTFTAGVDFTSGVWQDNGYGNGEVSFTGAQSIGDLFQNTIFSLNPDNVTIQINNEPAFTWNGGAGGVGTDTPGFGTNPIVPASPITITSITFTYRRESYISVNYDNQEIRLDAQNAGIRLDANQDIEMYGDNDINLQAENYLRLNAGQDVEIGSGGAYAVRIGGGDFVVSASDDISITGNDSFRLRNDSPTAPIRIITDDDNTSQTWAFNPNGSLQIPGDIRSEREINIDINLSDSTLQRWRFGEDGDLLYPSGIKIGRIEAPVLGTAIEQTDDEWLTVYARGTTGVGILGWSTDPYAASPAATISFNADTAGAVKIQTGDASSTVHSWTFDNTGDLTLPFGGAIVGNESFTYTFATDGYFTASTSSESTDYFFVTNNTANQEIAAGWTVVGANCNTTVDSVEYPVAGYPGVIKIYLTAPASSTSGFYPVVVASPTSNTVEIKPDPNNAEKFIFRSNGFTLPSIGGTTGPIIETITVSNGVNNFQGVVITPDPEFQLGQGLRIYPTFVDPEANHLHITANDPATIDLFLGDDDHYAKVASDGMVELSGNTVRLWGDGEMSNAHLNLPNNSDSASVPTLLSNYGAAGVLIQAGNTSPPYNWEFGADGRLTIPGDIRSEGDINIDINLSDSTLRRWTFTEGGDLRFPDTTVQTTAWTGTLTVNDSGLTINGGTGTIYQGPTGVLQVGDKKGGVYHAASTSSNGLFTFGMNGSGIMSAAVEGSLFVGNNLPSNNGGVTTAFGGWLVVENGGKFGADVDTLGNVILGKGVFEKFQAKQDATGTVEHDCINGHIFYHTSPDANWTANFTNLNIATGYATTVSIVIAQGGTGYYPDAVQIGGVAQTINWQGNATPTPSTNRTDVVAFSIINNSGTYIVLGQLTGF